MASFHGKIGWKGQRKRENKNYHYVSFLPDVQEKIPKKQQKKLKKLKETITDSSQAKIDGKGRDRETRKIITPFHSFPTGKRKFQKKQQKNSKN